MSRCADGLGDAPTSYGGDAGPRAARRGITTTLRLGNATQTVTTTRDLHGFSSPNADGDGVNNYNGSSQAGPDDEDAITSLPTLGANDTSYTVANIVVFNNTGNNATLYAWIDFNCDGQYQPGERTAVVVPSNAQTQTVPLTWTGLSGLVVGQSYLRRRLSTATTTISSWDAGNDGAFLATGYAADGEVEDYALQISSPTAVSLSSSAARGELHGLTGPGIALAYLWPVVLALSLGGLMLTRRIRRNRIKRT
jgi:hypothetical protein